MAGGGRRRRTPGRINCPGRLLCRPARPKLTSGAARAWHVHVSSSRARATATWGAALACRLLIGAVGAILTPSLAAKLGTGPERSHKAGAEISRVESRTTTRRTSRSEPHVMQHYGRHKHLELLSRRADQRLPRCNPPAASGHCRQHCACSSAGYFQLFPLEVSA